MPQRLRGVVARSKGVPVSAETIVILNPGRGEAVMQIQSCGECLTDLHHRKDGINDGFPFHLGQEAAGVVEAVEPDLVDIAPRSASQRPTRHRS